MFHPCDRPPPRTPPISKRWKRGSGSIRSTTCCSRADPARAAQLLRALDVHARRQGVQAALHGQYAVHQHDPDDEQTPVPGSNEIERRIKSLVRWNAMAMVVKANRASDGIGGHISTYASSATLYEVGFNHFFRGKEHESGGDFVYFQGHASPGMYARAFLEGRLSEGAAARTSGAS